MVTLPYHRGPDDQFSLAYVTPDADTFRTRLDGFSPPTRVLTAVDQSLSPTVYLAYTANPPTTSAADLTIPDHPFVDALLRVFAGVVDERRAMGDDVHANKQPALDQIPTVLSDRVEWQRPVPTVAGQLLSNLILTHALPNANHRTSLGALLLYLRSVGVDCSVADIEAAEVDAFIRESKRLLTVRRNTTKFRILAECGCTAVERKGGIRIPLAEYDLTVDDPYTVYAREHEHHAIQFVERLVDEEWQSREDPGLRTFLDRLQADGSIA